MPQTIKAAVVGTGGISKEHLSFLSGKTAHNNTTDQIELSAVCDLSEVSANYAAERFGANTAFTNFNTMISEAKPDVVHILTPPASHIPLASIALEGGAHVICEKPITTSTLEAEGLFDSAEAVGRKLTESHNYRFNDEIITIDEASRDGQLGSIKEVEIRISLDVTDPAGRFGDPHMPNPIHKLPAGVIHDFTTHFAYLMLHLSKAKFTRAGAFWTNQSQNEIFKFDNLDAILYGSDLQGDPVHGRLRFDSELAPDTFSITVRGDQGYTETDLFQPYSKSVVPRPGGTQLSPIINHVVNGTSLAVSGIRNLSNKVMQKSPYHGLHRMLDQTYLALINNDNLPVSKEDVLSTSALVDLLLSKEARL